MASPDYYEILGVSRDAGDDEINKAYRNLARQTHPDANPDDPDAANKFKSICGAYDVLKDPIKRRSYDRHVSGSFGDMFCFRRRAWEVRPLKHILVELEIDLIDAFQGCKKDVKVEKNKPCKSCSSEGYTEFKTCSTCLGKGVLNIQQGFFNLQAKCNVCKGRGQTPSKKCDKCRGSGNDGVENFTFKVNIPIGVQTGSQLVMKGEGEETPDGRFGDLLIAIKVREDDYFSYAPNGLDLEAEVSASYAELVLGSHVEVRTLGSVMLLKIPAGTKVGQIFKVEGQGMPSVENQKVRGNLLIKIVLDVPEKVSEKHKEILSELLKIEKKSDV